MKASRNLLVALAVVIGVPFTVVYFLNGSFAFALFASLPVLVISVWLVIIPRMKMERRAEELLVKIPQHDIKTIYLNFSSASPNAKSAAMALKIAQIEQDGWRFLKASEANPFKTIFSWGGGLNLYFIRELAKSPAATA